MITEHGQAIVELLRPVVAPMHVERTPNEPERYALKAKAGAILVGYQGREFDDPEAPSVFGVREIRFALTVMKRNVARYRGQDGVEETLDLLSETVRGFRFDGFIYYPTRDLFEDFSDGVWTYAQEITGFRVSELQLVSA